MKKQKKLSDNETLFRLDTWMALHQRLCWLILALLAVGIRHSGSVARSTARE